MRRDELYLLDILDAARNVIEFTKGKSFPNFKESYLLQVGVWKLIEIMGEAARKVSAEYKSKHPEIPWKEMVAMRHNLVHEYFRIDLMEVWAAVQQDIPPLIELLEPLVPPEE